MVLIWDRVKVLKRRECPSAVSLNCRFMGYLLKLGMFTQIRAQSRKALSLLPGRSAVARKAERQLFSLKSYVPLIISLQEVCLHHQRGLELLPQPQVLLPRVILQGLCPAVRFVLAPLRTRLVVVLTPASCFQQSFSDLFRQFCWRSCAAGHVHRTQRNNAGFMEMHMLEECHLFMLHFALGSHSPAGHCVFCDHLGCCRRQNIWFSTEVCNIGHCIGLVSHFILNLKSLVESENQS